MAGTLRGTQHGKTTDCVSFCPRIVPGSLGAVVALHEVKLVQKIESSGTNTVMKSNEISVTLFFVGIVNMKSQEGVNL